MNSGANLKRSLRGAARCGLYPVGVLRFPPATFSRASGANAVRYSTENSEEPCNFGIKLCEFRAVFNQNCGCLAQINRSPSP